MTPLPRPPLAGGAPTRDQPGRLIQGQEAVT